MSTGQAMAKDCEHHYTIHMRGGARISVRICQLCRAVDFADLDEQAAEIEQETIKALGYRNFGPDVESVVRELIAETLAKSTSTPVELLRTHADAVLGLFAVGRELYDGEPRRVVLTLKPAEPSERGDV